MGVSDWRFHDLRRTAASGTARIGVAPHVIEKVLNHQSGVISGVAAVYNRHGSASCHGAETEGQTECAARPHLRGWTASHPCRAHGRRPRKLRRLPRVPDGQTRHAPGWWANRIARTPCGSSRPKFPQWIARVSPEIARRDPYRLRVKETTMPRVNLTHKMVEATPVPLGRKSVDYFDRRMPGLVLRVSAGGTKSWNAVYRHHSRARRLTLGRFPMIALDDARNRAREALCTVSRGIDPAQTSASTFAELASLFIAGHVSKLRRARQVERLISRGRVSWQSLASGARPCLA